MRVRLLSFASAADAVGSGETELDLPAGSTVGDLKRLLAERHPDLGPLWERLAVAVNGELVGDGAAVSDGDEVALLPPVSGGRPRPARAALSDDPLVVDEVVARVAAPDCGAVVVFTGNVRDHHRGRAVERLTYDGYRPMALAALERIVAELEVEHGARVAIVHRLGTLEVGEPSVVIAVASPHREAAYAASRSALERLKREVPIWKKEHYADGGQCWREEEELVAGHRTLDTGH